MSTSIMIHRVERVHASSVHYSNANSVTLDVSTQDSGSFSITLFDLPTAAAEHLSRSLSDGCHMTEEEIRADERRRIAANLGL